MNKAIWVLASILALAACANHGTMKNKDMTQQPMMKSDMSSDNMMMDSHMNEKMMNPM